MKAIKQAIYSKYDGDTDLEAALTNGLFFQDAEGVDFPYGVFHMISIVPGRTFTEKMENCLFQFNLYSDNASDSEIDNMFQKLKACYDDAHLAVPGYYDIYLDREFSECFRVDDIWQYSTRYRCELEKWKIVNYAGQYYATAADNTVHDITTQDLSISAWIKCDPTAKSSYIIRKSQTVGAGFGFILTPAGILEGHIEDASGNDLFVTGTTDIRDGEWHHICMIIDRDANNLCKVFVDGTDDTVSRTGDVTTVGSISNNAVFEVSDPSGFNALNAGLTDLKIYYATNHWYAATHIAYQVGNAFDYSASAGTITEYWKCNKGYGTTLNGSAGNDLTLSSADAWE